jgi:hypothetical protein
LDPLAMRNFDVGLTGSPLAARRAHSSMSGRYPRSWHPSPFASDDDASSDEPQFFKEEKKNRIKMEIARRRQQIEENACLHDELTRLARLRENAEITDRLHPSATSQVGLYGNNPGMYSPNVGGVAVSGTAGTSVLKSVDEILRDGHHHNDLSAYSQRTNHYPSSTASRFGRTNNYDALYSMSGDLNLMSSTGVVGGHAPYHSDLYTGSTYDRVTDFSPINSEPALIDSRRAYDMDAYTSGGGKYPKYASYK